MDAFEWQSFSPKFDSFGSGGYQKIPHCCEEPIGSFVFGLQNNMQMLFCFFSLYLFCTRQICVLALNVSLNWFKQMAKTLCSRETCAKVIMVVSCQRLIAIESELLRFDTINLSVGEKIPPCIEYFSGNYLNGWQGSMQILFCFLTMCLFCDEQTGAQMLRTGRCRLKQMDKTLLLLVWENRGGHNGNMLCSWFLQHPHHPNTMNN